jgi:hypothetical protein
VRYRTHIHAAVVLAVLAGGFAAFGLVAPANAATPCAKKILEDWFDNSRIDGTYPLHCYPEAIDAIPPDISPYSNAADAIKQAWLAAGGRVVAAHKTKHPGGTQPPTVVPIADASSPSSLPLPLLVLGGMSLALLAAGGAGYLTRRRRANAESDEDDLT